MAGHSSKPDICVLVVPLPIHGHLNQLLHLSCLLAPHLSVHFAATAAHSSQACHRINGSDPLSFPNLVFHQLPMFHFQSPMPEIDSPTCFPSHLQPLFNASATFRCSVTELMRRLCAVHRRTIVIYDSLMASVVQDLVNFPNAEGYVFHSVSAYTIFLFLWENLGKPFSVEPEILQNVPSIDGCFTPAFIEFMRNQHGFRNLHSGRIYNTSKVLESRFLNLLARPEISDNKKQWALGPFNPIFSKASGKNDRHYCLEWLDRQPENSVILVSFGTTTTLPEKQIQELAIGLEESQQRFVWVVRGADTVNGGTGRIDLPIGFEDRVRDFGVIVRDWAPQLEILGHSAIGGFMSHCGWNSSIESISTGVPIATWPIHSDQPRNAVLITGVLKIGMVAREWERREEIVEAEAVKTLVWRLMASEEGEMIRTRAAEIGAALRKAVGDGGIRCLDLDSFISHIKR